jgi:phenylpropionate dioxygenase-like ring-hydroxylating dioxygenase large terminal subunit
MIPNQWYAILSEKELRGKKPIGVTRLGEKLVVWRLPDGSIGCLHDRCCHRGASLSHGTLSDNGHVLRCPFHGFAYDTSGKVTMIPANGRMTPVPDRYRVVAYPAVARYGMIWVWYGERQDPLPDIPFFQELRSGFSYGQFAETWPVHYTRAIENQLDVVHLPFVHANSIGRGGRTLIHGPVVTWQDNLMTFYVYNAVDDGQTKPLKPSEIEHYENLFSLQLQLPNSWQNRISDDVRIVAFFAPIDDQHTRIYLRFYQRFIRLPLLRQIVNGLSQIGNRSILHQDRRVVITQRPVKSELKMGENLIQGDAPIIEFRKRRALLKGEINNGKA